MTLQWQERLSALKTKTFIIGLTIRVALLFLSGGAIFQNLFIPFLDHFAQNPFSNPWSAFPPEYFPYGLFPLLILGIPKVIAFKLFGTITLGATAFNYFLIKSILLIFDTLLFWILTRFTRINNNRLTWFYWLNPIVIYVSFILGHFDVISMGLIIMSLFLISKRYIIAAGLVAGLALTSKFQVAIVLPFIAAYLWNNNFRQQALKQMAQFFLSTAITAAMGFLPVLAAQHLSYSTLSSPEAQRLLAAQLMMGEGIAFIIGVALVLLALGRLIFSTRISYSGLLFGSGFLLGCLVLTTNAHPGWYLWLVPFLALFFANYVTAPSLIFIFMVGVYFIHFLLLGFNPLLSSLSFTVLQISVLVQLLILYWLNLRHEAQLKNRLRPIMLGLSGDSGAGKNHLSNTIQALLNPNNCIIIEGDNYHKWERGDKNWDVLTHLNPNANNLLKMQHHASQITRGQSILHHHYDHTTGRFVEQSPINPTKAIIFQGLHSLYLKSLREILDLKIFLDPNDKVRTFWKIQRDVFERGHSLEKVLESLQKRKEDSKLHIQPQRMKSDWIIEISTDGDFDPLSLKKDSQLPIYLKYTLFNDEPITEVLEELKAIGLHTTIDFLVSDIDKIMITIKGDAKKEQIIKIAEKLFPQMRHITRSSVPPEFLGGFEGIHQLFLLALLNKRLEATT